MSASEGTNDLCALTVLVPRTAASLLAERGQRHGRPTEFEATMSLLEGMVVECHQMGLDLLATALCREARAYAVLAGYPDAVNLPDERQRP